MNYNSIKIGEANKRRFNNMELTANLTYFINKNRGDVFTVAYERWFEPIPYSAISPVITQINEYSFTKGNLDLKPMVTDNLFLTLMLRDNTEFVLRLQTTDYDDINYLTFIDSDNPLVTYTMPFNGTRSYNARISLDHTFKITGWWRMYAYTMLEWRRYEHPYRVGNYEHSWISTMYINNTITLKNGMGGTVNFTGRTSSKLLERKYGPAAALSFSVYKYLLNRKLRVTLDCTPYSLERWTITETDQLWSKHYPRTNTTRAAIRVVYNFNSGKRVRVKQTTDGVQSYNEIKDELLTQ